MPEPRKRRLDLSHAPAAGVALAGAAVLAYWWRLSRTLWVDEEMIALNARWRSFGDLASPLWLDQTSPLGWLAVERSAMLAFGTDERAVRALTVLFGIGTLAAAVWVGRRWMTPAGAVVLAALCSMGAWMVFFTLELKHYSADTCWALLLPALAAWATEADGASRIIRRAIVWWGAAAAGLWLSNGALFVTPACALLLVGRTWQHHGARAATRAALPAVIWLVSFSADYLLVLRHALGNEYLTNYWRFAFPPVADGPTAALQWIRGWIETFPVKPGGSRHWVMFWVAALTGFMYATMRFGSIGVAFAAVPVAALALAVGQFVPPFERLALWVVPSLYVGIAFCADAAVWLVFESRWRRSTVGAAGALVLFVLVGIVTEEVVRSGRVEVGVRKVENNYGLDDRRSVRRVLGLRQPGDPILTTHFGLAGLWWYGDVNLADAQRGGFLADSPIFEISHERRAARCAAHRALMDAVVQRTGRAILYLGFRMNVEPEGFDKLVLDELTRRGAATGYRRYADRSYVSAFDFRRQPNGTSERFFRHHGVVKAPLPPDLEGCVAIRPAQRW